LEMDGYRVETAATAAQVLARPDWSCLDAVVLDRKLPDGSAEELLPQLKRLAPQAAVIIVTGYAHLEGALAAVRQGAAGYLRKPSPLPRSRPRLAGLAERKRSEEPIARPNKDIQHRMTETGALVDVAPIGIPIAEDPTCRTIRVNGPFSRLLRLAPDANASLT